MLARGAKVVSLSRGVSRGKGTLPEVDSINCDLSNLTSVTNAVDQLGNQKIDILICNSGVAMRERKQASDEIEMTFAVNVLGHHLLYRMLQERNLFTEKPRIVMTTGEAYFVSKKCEVNPSQYRMDHVYGGSKLGNLWQVLELVRRYPSLQAFAVHPGVILSGFGGGIPKGFRHWLASKILISEKQGAQAALIAASQDIPNGTYWHNTCGIMSLPEEDAALDTQKAETLWRQLEMLIKPFLAK
ncbi:SDR family NAD(P)-dependent oxidoreductase [Microbulbifer spongiae]|uniref:SDR family NAD(P)-dependent oxidoreductase n=2 Tax=Microbulbifer spongiae TaxID=2944933 RepID=A0ABY9EI68_9GAMM|nr:SDR family NAD(P)-dependent oxidoreductase [Microbulbifer sp. MI-G]WKD51664.1 SDR family NAD(P)-dependent oxidoreductase [Microbulbifer sp. MI-G]